MQKVPLANFKNSKFRSSFSLKQKDIEYIDKIGLDKIKLHAKDFINKRVALANIQNDGKQTPYNGHPVFIAEHATATCCRSCINKWYKIPKDKQLSEEEVNYIVDQIMEWIKIEIDKYKGKKYE